MRGYNTRDGNCMFGNNFERCNGIYGLSQTRSNEEVSLLNWKHIIIDTNKYIDSVSACK